MRLEILGHGIRIDETLVKHSKGEIREQVREYLGGAEIDLELAYPDSFTGRVMRVIDQVPYGETRSYGEVAGELGTPAVAVGQACSRNPLPVIVPCHRVVCSRGKGGYAYGRELKRELLELESQS